MPIKVGNRSISAMRLGDRVISRAYLGDRLVFDAQPGPAFDADALAYITAVEAADGQELEPGVREAINSFVVGCKADGIFDALKASCILAGARTLDGALVPLVGTAPTNFNFVSGDYNRVTGLKGDGATKSLDSNRANNADPQNSNHMAVFAGEMTNVSGPALIGSSTANTNGIFNNMGFGGSGWTFRVRSTGAERPNPERFPTPGIRRFFGLTRNNPNSMLWRDELGTETVPSVSTAPASNDVFVFGRGANEALSGARISFYSIGEHLDLEALDARVTTLMSDIGAAIQ